MDEQKLRRLIALVVPTAILLLVILLSIMIYQMIAIKIANDKVDAINHEIEIIRQENEDKQDEIDLWLNDWKIEEKARELGWLYGSDK